MNNKKTKNGIIAMSKTSAIFFAVIFILPNMLLAEEKPIDYINGIIAKADSINKADPLPEQDYPYCIMETILRSDLMKGVTPGGVDSLLAEPDFFARAKAAAILSKGVAFDTLTSIEMLISAMDEVINNPLPQTEQINSYLDNCLDVRSATTAVDNTLYRARKLS